MEENNPIITKLRKEMKKLDSDFDLLPANTQNHLIKIATRCNEMIEEEIQRHNTASKEYLSVNRISQDTKISRQTFYNNPILSKYVFYKADEYKAIDDSYNLSQLQEENRSLKEKIEKMMVRDLEIYQLRETNKRLANEVKNKTDLIQSLERRLYSSKK